MAVPSCVPISNVWEAPVALHLHQRVLSCLYSRTSTYQANLLSAPLPERLVQEGRRFSLF